MGAISVGLIRYCSDNRGRKREDVFLEQVKKTPTCWLWQGCCSSPGYRNFHNEGAHRWMYRYTHGTIPEGKWILHHCDNPPCVNPKHLYAGTQDNNERDKVIRQRVPKHPGELSYNHKLTNEIVLSIRSFQGKLSSRKTASKFGISSSHVAFIWNRKRWGHL